MLGLEWNELALVVFLSVLITAAGWLPRVGEWLGEFVGGFSNAMKKPTDHAEKRSAPPAASDQDAGTGKDDTGGQGPGA